MTGLLGYRKFLLSLAGILAGGALAYFGRLDASTATLIGGIVAAYNAANVTSSAVGQTSTTQ